MKRLLLCYSTLLLLLQAAPSLAQPKSFSSTDPEIKARQFYSNEMGASAALYEGKEFINYNFRIEGTPFYSGDQLQKGSIYHAGILYNDVSMKYDLVGNVPVIFHNDLTYPIKLAPESTPWFRINGHRFERLVKETEESPVPETGYYDIIIDDEISFLVKRQRSILEETENLQVRRWYENRNDYYLKKDGEFHEIKARRHLLNVLDDRRKEVKKFLKQNDLKVRKQREEAIRRAVEYYNSLS